MKFIDEVTIEARAGNGGPGSQSFRREKFVPRGGPDGGNGGNGGSVIVRGAGDKHTLLDLKYRPRWYAQNGRPGQGSQKDGKSGQDLVLEVPPGTEVFDQDRELLCDIKEEGQEFVLLRGGKGGKGNVFFKSATNRAPDYAQPGEEGPSGTFHLTLKLIADVGIIGLPNAGKSTLISSLSAAKPKVADYPFTTLTPNLGVAKTRTGKALVLADIPGLIPGAHTGKGLGIRFLKHIERTGALIHMIDVSEATPNNGEDLCRSAFELINKELEHFSHNLAARPQIVALNKIDAVPDRKLLESGVNYFKSRGLSCFLISAVSGEGLIELMAGVEKAVEKNRGVKQELPPMPLKRI